MKKTLLIGLILMLTITTACSKYRVESNLTAEREAEYRDSIEIYEETLADENLSESERVETLQQMGIAWDRLGYYDKAIEYYEQVLGVDPTEATVLNNMVAIYEVLEDYDKAILYMNDLYLYYPYDSGVVNDAIDLLVKAGEFSAATEVVTLYSKYVNSEKLGGATEADLEFISEKYDYIIRYEEKHGN